LILRHLGLHDNKKSGLNAGLDLYDKNVLKLSEYSGEDSNKSNRQTKPTMTIVQPPANTKAPTSNNTSPTTILSGSQRFFHQKK